MRNRSFVAFRASSVLIVVGVSMAPSCVADQEGEKPAASPAAATAPWKAPRTPWGSSTPVMRRTIQFNDQHVERGSRGGAGGATRQEEACQPVARQTGNYAMSNSLSGARAEDAANEAAGRKP